MTRTTRTTRTTRGTRDRRLLGAGSVLAAAVALAVTAAPAQADPVLRGTVRISTGVNGAAPDDQSWSQGVSADGRYALFTSWAKNLVPQPTVGGRDAYLRDLRTGRTERVNLSDSGEALNGWTDQAAINADGRYVAFESNADNVVPGMQVKGRTEVYLRDRRTGRTELVSGGLTATDTDQFHASYAPQISADGRYVVYVSSRTDLDPTVVDPAPGAGAGAGAAPGAAPSLARPYTWKINVYLTDRRTHTTRLISRDTAGKPGESTSFRPTISANGRTIGFGSLSELLPTGPTPAPAAPTAPSARAAAPELALARPTSAVYYTWNAASGKLTPASYDVDGKVADADFDATVSPDGRYAVYSLPEPGGSTGGHRYHTVLHVRDLRTGAVRKVSGGLPGTTSVGSSGHGSITADNRWLYFDSAADNLVPGPQHPGWDVYRQDLRTGRTERVTTAPDGSAGNGSSNAPFVSAAGNTLVFESTSGNLVAGTDAPAAEGSQAFARPTGSRSDDGDDQGEDQDD
ncbi:TolB family protein [Kitasatospora sp. NPDC056076]|uniref:TolB family protein n=1 Tax=Kitasatospora sp. NPDC056076 TaxID=3345703 RepID=UPI0035D77C02